MEANMDSVIGGMASLAPPKYTCGFYHLAKHITYVRFAKDVDAKYNTEKHNFEVVGRTSMDALWVRTLKTLFEKWNTNEPEAKKLDYLRCAILQVRLPTNQYRFTKY